MIVNCKTGILVAGSLAKDPELKHVGQHNRPVLKTSLRYDSEIDDTGKARGKFIDIDLWDGAEDLGGMLAKGDAVLVVAKEVKGREYNGKVYHSVSADGLFVSAQVLFRWMQQIVDMIPAVLPPEGTFTPVDEALPEEFVQSDDNPIAEGEMCEGEQLSAYTPRTPNAIQQPMADDLIDETEDLPF